MNKNRKEKMVSRRLANAFIFNSDNLLSSKASVSRLKQWQKSVLVISIVLWRRTARRLTDTFGGGQHGKTVLPIERKQNHLPALAAFQSDIFARTSLLMFQMKVKHSQDSSAAIMGQPTTMILMPAMVPGA